MTPEEARELLKNTTPGDEWHYQVKWGHVQYIEPVAVIPGGEVDVTEEDAALIVAAPIMAAMIAGMREEWGVEERHEYTGEWTWHSTHPDRESACNAVNGMDHFRIVRRYVTEPEVTE